MDWFALIVGLLKLAPGLVSDGKAAAKAFGKTNGGPAHLHGIADTLGKLAGDVRDAATELAAGVGD
jgi:hypothetical protein